MRHDIDLLLEELWRDAACRDAIRAVAARDEGVVLEFLSAVLNDLMYLFKVGGWGVGGWRRDGFGSGGRKGGRREFDPVVP